MPLKLAFLMIIAPDLARAKDFYGTTLGFPLKSETDNRLVFASADADLVIFRGSADAPQGEHGATASTTIVFEARDLQATITDFKRKGVRFLHETPASNEWGRYGAFFDPFGNVLELLQPNEQPAKSGMTLLQRRIVTVLSALPLLVWGVNYLVKGHLFGAYNRPVMSAALVLAFVTIMFVAPTPLELREDSERKRRIRIG